jgi:hypothetical protein
MTKMFFVLIVSFCGPDVSLDKKICFKVIFPAQLLRKLLDMKTIIKIKFDMYYADSITP